MPQPGRELGRVSPHAYAEAELGFGPQMADFRAANLNPFLRGTDRGLGLAQLPATCVPTSPSLQVLGTGPDHACSQVRGRAIQGFSSLHEGKCWPS